MIFFLLKNSDIDDCAMNPCSHGTCQDESNDFTCTCETGWEGKKCEKGLMIFFLLIFMDSEDSEIFMDSEDSEI